MVGFDNRRNRRHRTGIATESAKLPAVTPIPRDSAAIPRDPKMPIAISP
jgi:hypothetical protein